MRLRRRVYLPLSVALLSMAVMAYAKQAKTLKIEGTASGPVLVTDRGGGEYGLEVRLSGKTTHLGSTTMTLRSAGKFQNGVPVPLPPSTFEVTAANGDTLHGNFKWLNEPLGGNRYRVYGPIHTLEGTGRFEGATGDGAYDAVIDLNTLRVVGSFKTDVVIPK